MNLIEYMPPFLKENREFNEIFNTEDIELRKLLTKIDEMTKEAIVQTAEGYGLNRYEKIYNITDIANTMEGRRANILFKMNYKVPYTLKWLINTLNIAIGAGNYRVDIDYDNYILNIKVLAIYKNIANDLEKSLRKEIPANLVLKVNLFQTEEMKNKYIAGIVHIGKNMKIKQEVF